MDIMLHLTGLVFMPFMAYILFMGVRDIFSEIDGQFMSHRTVKARHKTSSGIPLIYEFTAQRHNQTYCFKESNTPIS